jgi:hypothetical protein
MSSSKYKSIVVYDLYGISIQTSVSLLCDPKGSRPHVTCDVCCLGEVVH